MGIRAFSEKLQIFPLLDKTIIQQNSLGQLNKPKKFCFFSLIVGKIIKSRQFRRIQRKLDDCLDIAKRNELVKALP